MSYSSSLGYLHPDDRRGSSGGHHSKSPVDDDVRQERRSRNQRDRSKSRRRGGSHSTPRHSRHSSHSSVTEQLSDLFDRSLKKVRDNPEMVVAATAATTVLGQTVARKWKDGTIPVLIGDLAEKIDDFTGDTSFGKRIRRLSSSHDSRGGESDDDHAPDLPEDEDYNLLNDERKRAELDERLRRNWERRRTYEQVPKTEATLDDIASPPKSPRPSSVFQSDGYSQDGRRYSLYAVDPASSEGATAKFTGTARGILRTGKHGGPPSPSIDGSSGFDNQSVYNKEDHGPADQASASNQYPAMSTASSKSKAGMLSSFPKGSKFVTQGGEWLRDCRGCSERTKDRVESEENRGEEESVIVRRAYCYSCNSNDTTAWLSDEDDD